MPTRRSHDFGVLDVARESHANEENSEDPLWERIMAPFDPDREEHEQETVEEGGAAAQLPLSPRTGAPPSQIF